MQIVDGIGVIRKLKTVNESFAGDSGVCTFCSGYHGVSPMMMVLEVISIFVQEVYLLYETITRETRQEVEYDGDKPNLSIWFLFMIDIEIYLSSRLLPEFS
ncbi:hypothetical protein ACET3Z_018842 [Daucus carota]